MTGSAGLAPAAPGIRRIPLTAIGLATTEVAIVLAFLSAALVSQVLSSAYDKPMGGYPDEPSHYLGSLLVRDYLAAGVPASPISYATEYYAHYPAFAIGFWPPLFYAVGGTWMMIFGYSRTSMLVLCAVICAVLQYLLYRVSAAEFGRPTALVSAAVVPFVPAVAQSISLIMTDVLLTLMCFVAGISFARLLEKASAGRAVAFGAAVAAALLTKSSAVWLLLQAPATLVVNRNLRFVLRRELWLGAFALAAIFGPWFLFTHHLSTRGLLQSADAELLTALGRYVRVLYMVHGGWVLLIAAAAMTLIAVRSASAMWCAIAVQPVCIALILSTAPVHLEVRYGLMALPAIVLLACHAVRELLRRLALTAYLPLAIVPVLGSMLLVSLPPPPDVGRNLGLAIDYAAGAMRKGDVLLVSSDALGTEVLMVSEFASRESIRPARTVVRANKVLAATDWNGIHYRLKANTTTEALSIVEGMSIDFILVNGAPARRRRVPHHELLLTALESAPERWRVVFRSAGSEYLVYRAVE